MLRYLYVFWEPLTSVYYMSLQQNIGVALRALRAQKGVLQEKLALETGIGRRYMSDIENGRRNVSLEIVKKIAAYFRMSASELVGRIEQVDGVLLSRAKQK